MIMITVIILRIGVVVETISKDSSLGTIKTFWLQFLDFCQLRLSQ
jgi:hypothetical protein